MPAPVRRDPRDEASIFIVVSGFDAAGHFFTEHTITANVSDNGCCFRLNHELSFDALIAIQTAAERNDTGQRPALYQVAWMERLAKGALVGVARLHGDSAWHLVLPPVGEPM